MPKYKPYNYNQDAMVVINFEKQLQPGTFEHALHHLISDRLDLSIFHECYNNDTDAGGRSAYDPAILLKVILFAYSKGITSSREIMWNCEHNILFKALSCDTVPHFTTIAAFVSRFPKQLEQLFEQIVLVCYQEKLIGNDLFAIDGCKLPSNAAKEWSGTFDELKSKRNKLRKRLRTLIREHRELDKRHPDHDTRAQRKQQSIDTLNAAFDRVDRFLKTHSPRMGQGTRPKEVKSNITDNESAKITTSKGTLQGYNGIATVDKKHQIIVDAQAFGHGQEHHTLIPALESMQARFTRLGIPQKSHIITADTGYSNHANNRYLYENGINAWIPDNRFRQRDARFSEQKEKYGKRHQTSKKKKPDNIIPASEFRFDKRNRRCVCPAGESLSWRGDREDSSGKMRAWFEGRLLQCRHCDIKVRCMTNPSAADHRTGRGRQVSFLLEHTESTNVYTEWMKRRVDSDKGKEIYSHRMSVVEPVFANICTNKKLNRFSLRGREKVQGQWQLFCMVHNVEKLMNYGKVA